MQRWSLFLPGSLWDHNRFMGLHLLTYLFKRCLINTYYVLGRWPDTEHVHQIGAALEPHTECALPCVNP